MRRTFMAAVVATALVAGCGGGGTAPEEYAATVCTSMAAWFQDIFEGSEVLQGLPEGTTAEEGKQQLVSYLGDVVAATDRLISELGDVGAPDVEGGEDVHDTLLAGFEQAKTAYEGARDSAEQLPTDSPEAFEQATDVIGAELDAAFANFGGDLEQEAPQELKDAFEQAPACSETGLFG